MTWDDVFKAYELRYSFLLKKLDVDKTALLKRPETDDPSRETANELSEQILEIGGSE
jgi:hypothetical protein